jgi:transcription elongation factor GreA
MAMVTDERTTVRVGSRVRLRTDHVEEEYRVVAPEDAAPAAGLISMQSPVGRALLGRAVGEQVSVRTPEGVRGLTVVSVE